MKMFSFTNQQSDQHQQQTTTKHLLGRSQKGRGGMLHYPRVERTRGPNEGGDQQDRHSDGRMATARRRKSQRRSKQNANAAKPSGQTEPDHWLRSWGHATQPSK